MLFMLRCLIGTLLLLSVSAFATEANLSAFQQDAGKGSSVIDWINAYCPYANHSRRATRSSSGPTTPFKNPFQVNVKECPPNGDSECQLGAQTKQVTLDVGAAPENECGIPLSQPPPFKLPSGLTDVDKVTQIVAKIREDIQKGNKKVNTGTSDCYQVASADMPIFEAKNWIQKGAAVFVTDKQNNVGLLNSFDESENGGLSLGFIGSGQQSSTPYVDDKGNVKGAIVVPPGNTEARLATGGYLGTKLTRSGKSCDVCGKNTTTFLQVQTIVDEIRQRMSEGYVYGKGVIPTDRRRRSLVTERDTDTTVDTALRVCPNYSKKKPCTGGATESQTASRLFDCLEAIYPAYFPGPEVTQQEDMYKPDIFYYRYYSLCGSCGEVPFSDSILGSYHWNAYYAFDGNTSYFAPLNDAIAYFCSN